MPPPRRRTRRERGQSADDGEGGEPSAGATGAAATDAAASRGAGVQDDGLSHATDPAYEGNEIPLGILLGESEAAARREGAWTYDRVGDEMARAIEAGAGLDQKAMGAGRAWRREEEGLTLNEHGAWRAD